MKLVRLCSSNNGVFTSNFGNDMVLEEKSKMALLNLTFTSDIGQIVIDNNSSITTQTDDSNDLTSIVRFLDGDKFNTTQEGYDRFVAVVEHALNKTLGFGRGIDALANNTGSQYRILKDNSGSYVIIFRYCPLISPLNYFIDPQSPFTAQSVMDQAFSIKKTTTSEAGGPVPFFDIDLTLEDGELARTTNDANIISSTTQISTGSGYMTARIANLVDNTSVLEDNGFAIGLTNVCLSTIGINAGDEIPISRIFAEIRVNKPLQQFRYRSITEGTTEFTSNVYPHRVAATPLVTGYLNLPLGNTWTQAPAAATENFDEINLGPIATYRRTQVGSAIEHWWEATSATAWNVYFTGPPTPNQAVDTSVTADLTTGVLSFDTSGTTFTPTGGAPAVVTIPVNVNVHDVMGMEITQNKLSVCVYQDKVAPNNRQVIFEQDIPVGTELYPYLYINGSKDHVKVDMNNWTANSLETLTSADFVLNGDPDGEGWGPDERNGLFFNKDNGMRNGQQRLQRDAAASNIQSALPSVYYKQDIEDRRFEKVTLDMTLKMPKQILRNLGFKNMEDDGDNIFNGIIVDGVWTTADFASGLPSIYNSDNFIVESTSLRLDSYDASRVMYNTNVQFAGSAELSGRRKNILMTIPSNDNNNGLVEYETNTPIFIDIGNAEKINVKNLNLRVLRKDFSAIKQGNELAIMTLLIDN